ncbi:hypothetical protein ES703_18789 [subsurface metagenome]
MSADVTTKPILMNDLLHWQLEKIESHARLLQEHAADPTCACELDLTSCLRKHCLMLESYATETLPMVQDERLAGLLYDLSIEARDMKEKVAASVCGDGDAELDLAEVAQFGREWAKRVETGYTCPISSNPELEEVAMANIGQALGTGLGIGAGLVVAKTVLEKKDGNPNGEKGIIKDYSKLRDWELEINIKKGYEDAIAEGRRRGWTILTRGQYSTLTGETVDIPGIMIMRSGNPEEHPRTSAGHPLSPKEETDEEMHAFYNWTDRASFEELLAELCERTDFMGAQLCGEGADPEGIEGDPLGCQYRGSDEVYKELGRLRFLCWKVTGKLPSSVMVLGGSNSHNPIALSVCEKEHGLGPKLERCMIKIEESNIEKGCPPMGLGTKKCPNPVAVCRASISQPICSVKVESPKVSGEASIDLPEQEWKQPRWCPGIAAADKELKQASRALTTTKSRITGIRKNLTTALNICAGQAEMFEQPIAVLDPYGSRCRDPKTGLWTHSEECGFEPIGIKTTALGAGGLTHYEFEFHVVEGHSLVVSHDPFTFVPNPDYPKNLQPRLRERVATKAQVEKIAANIEPDALLTDFHVLDRGAPIIGSDLVVEAGNGRVMALIRAYEEHPESYRNYHDRLVERIRDFGLRSTDVTDISLPILVRIRLTEVDRAAFTQEANAMATIAPSAIENARTDAEKITIVMIQELRVSEDESIEDALRADKNLPFARSFLKTLPEEVQASLVDAKGRLNRDGVHRMAMAIFVSAFQGDNGLRLAEKAFESIDMDIRNAVNAIARSLGAIAQAESLIRSGDRDSELAIGDDLAQAVSVYSAIKTTPALTVDKYLAQEQLFERELTDFQEGILIVLEKYRRSPKKLGRVFTAYAEGVIASPPPAQTAMFPEAKISKRELWEKALGQAEHEPEAREAPSLFQADPLLDEITHQICSMSSREHGFTICSDKCRLLRGPESVGHKYGVTVDISCPEGAEPIGTYHSHPSDFTLSGQDKSEMVRLGLPVACVGVPDSGVTCYLISRCGANKVDA